MVRDGLISGWLDGWMDGWMDSWMAGWIDGWNLECFKCKKESPLPAVVADLHGGAGRQVTVKRVLVRNVPVLAHLPVNRKPVHLIWIGLLLLPTSIGLREHERHCLRVLDLELERIPESENGCQHNNPGQGIFHQISWEL